MTAGIMIVDDEQDVISFVTNVLRQNGYANVKGFSDARKALRDFEQTYKDYALVISDIRMTYMNGLLFAREIKKIHPSVSIALMTRFEMTKHEFDIVFPSLKINELITKPVRGSEILALVTKYVLAIEKH